MEASTSSQEESFSEEKVVKMKKDNAVSLMFREKAEALMVDVHDANVYEIISKYNKAVACAEKGSSTLALAFAGRSRIAACIGYYKPCLFNINLAKSSNYPEHQLQELLDFEKRMTLKLENSKPPEREENTFFKLSHPANDDLPFMIDAIKIRQDMNGHHLITKIPLKCGDIVAIEKTFASSSLAEASTKKCSNCNKYSLLNLLPCEECCSAMFCSMRCYKAAKFGYHSFECVVIDEIKRSYDNYHIEFLLLKPLFKALAMFQGSVKYLRHFLNKSKKLITMFDLILTRPNMVSQKDLLNLSMTRSCWCPYTTAETRRRENDYEFFMRMYPKINDLMKITDYKKFLFGFLMTQSYGVTAQASSREQPGIDRDFFGAVSSLKKFMTHSCVPNIHSFVYENGDLAHIVQSPIPAGGQLTTSHTYDFQQQPVDIRHNLHVRTFGITCKCNACSKSPMFPMEIDMQIINREMYRIVLEQTMRSENLTAKLLVDEFNANCKFFNDSVKDFPTQELVMIQYCNMKIINQLLGHIFMK